jgi:hypothetical protein
MYVSSRDAAARLRVTERQIRNMVQQGQLEVLPGATNILITAESLARTAQTPRRTGRPWTQRTAWAAIDLLSGGTAPWLTPAERYRVRQSLKTLTVDQVIATARNRATPRRFRAVPEAHSLLRHHIVPTGASAMAHRATAERFGLAGNGSGTDGYVGPGTSVNIAASLGMVPDPQGNVVLREVEFQDALQADVPVAAVALDLTEAVSTREQSAGRRVLEELLAQQWAAEQKTFGASD